MKNWSVGQQTFFRFVCSDGAYLELAVPQLPVRADGAQPLRDVRPVPSHRGPGGLSQPRPDRQVGPPQPLRDVRQVPSHRGPGGLSQPRPDRPVGPLTTTM